MGRLQLCFSNLFRSNALGVCYRYLICIQVTYSLVSWTTVNHFLTCVFTTKKKTLHLHHTNACLLGWPKGLILPTTRFHAFRINFISRSHFSHPRVVSFSADAVYSSFFTVSPYLKSLSMVAANKLLHLLEVRAC